jgi:hypothetical protein
LYEKQVLEKWLKQISNGEIDPEFLGLGSDKDNAIKKLKNQITQISQNKKLR